MAREATGEKVRPLECKPVDETLPVAAESRSPLYPSRIPAEFALQAGKVQNLRRAAARLHGLKIPAGAIFSFWKNVGRPTPARGFVPGRELREGCIIPSIGGGLCQLSNALYDAALTAGFELVERHAHSRIILGSMAEAGRDATIFWNYVDLRFRPPMDCQLEVKLTVDDLVVCFRGGRPVPRKMGKVVSGARPMEAAAIGSCESCGMVSCFRHLEPGSGPCTGITAWLVDAWGPEYGTYLQAHRKAEDWLFTPLDSRRLKLGPYRWRTEGFAQVRQAPLTVLWRSLRSRKLAAQGAVRQQALLQFDERLARNYARRIPPEAMHLVVSQNLLPTLWRDGVLGGRTFDVLMTRLPLYELEATLDRAKASHPESRTLADFRAEPELVALEKVALAAARHWITPHRTIAALAEERAVQLDWQIPAGNTHRQRGNAVAFPASTLGRKGAYELRAAARELGLCIQLSGPVIEDAAFWQGVETIPAGEDWLAGVAAVVLPAWVEHQPRRLLAAVAAGVPVIATEACGLSGVPGVITIPNGDPKALIEALRTVFATC